MKINLGDFQQEGSAIFSGREFATNIRKQLELDKLELTAKEITIVIPQDTISVNTSFFLSLFGSSIRSMGKVNFLNKYKFECDEIIKEGIMDDIEIATKTSSVLE